MNVEKIRTVAFCRARLLSLPAAAGEESMTALKTRSRTARWTTKLRRLRVLSLRQPWAWLVVNGYKDIENRLWRTNHRGPLLIHASNNRSFTTPKSVAAIENKYRVRLPNNFPFGGIVGVVDVVDCLKRHPSIWKIRGNWRWVLTSPRRLAFRKQKGAVGFFKLKSHR